MYQCVKLARRLLVTVAVCGLVVAGPLTMRAALAQAPDAVATPGAEAAGRVARAIDLAELGFADGARLSGLGGSRDFFFPVPKGARLRGAVLSLAFETASSTDSRRGVEVLAGERTLRVHRVAGPQERETLNIPLDGVNATNGFLRITVRYGGLIEDRCVDLRFATDHLTVLPETTLTFAVDREAFAGVGDTLAAMPRVVDVYLPPRALTRDEFTAALVAARGLRQSGREVKFRFLPSGDLTSSITPPGRPPVTGSLAPSRAPQPSTARFLPPASFGSIAPAAVVSPDPAPQWSRGSVIIAASTEIEALGLGRKWNGESASGERATAAVSPEADAPTAGLSLVRFGVGPALLISGEKPQTAARLIGSQWRAAATRADVAALVADRATRPRGVLTFDRLQTDLGARGVIDRATWSVSVGGKDLPLSSRAAGARIDVAVAPDEARSNAVVSAFFNERLMDSVTTDNRRVARLAFDIPRGMAGLRNNLRVVVQRQPRGGECLTMPMGSPAQLLDSSAIVVAPGPEVAGDFFELAPKFRDGVNLLVEADGMFAQANRLAVLAEFAGELIPDGAPVEVTFVQPGVAPRPSGPFMALTSRPPEHALMPIRLDQGRAIVKGPDGSTVADIGGLGATMVAQVVRAGADSGLWIRSVETADGMVVPASLQLDRGNAAIIDKTGVAFAFSSERDRLVEIAYPDRTSMAEIANAWRPWIIGAL